MQRLLKPLSVVSSLCLLLALSAPVPADDGPFQSVEPQHWTELSVRKVLHTFAYGGLATDAQIQIWADMDPRDAIVEILTFSYSNEQLSPAEDASELHANSLEALQDFWGGDDDDNPMHWEKRSGYTTLTTNFGLSILNQQQTWVQAVNTRGINPFLHRIAYYLTNQQMAIPSQSANMGPFRAYYDQVLADLVAGKPFAQVIAGAAKSTAVSLRYEHKTNRYSETKQKFYGNDDFAREFLQLFFRLQGETEDPDYHEAVTIDNNARLLTGMQVDSEPGAYGAHPPSQWVVAPIDFTDHTDGRGNVVSNDTNHHKDCLEILHQQICGATAEEKIDAVADIVAAHQEVLDNLPVFIISSLADDNLTEEKKDTIRASWLLANDDLLRFLRAYAISRTFHNKDTYKFKSATDRNVTLHNLAVLDNQEAFVARVIDDSARRAMLEQGENVFQPAHDVFGWQTGAEVAVNLNSFRSAFEVSTDSIGIGLSLNSATYFTDSTLATEVDWYKNWSSVVPTDANGNYKVSVTAQWLWNRFVADNGENFDWVARTQIYALLATGYDFGYVATLTLPPISGDPQATYSSQQLSTDPSIITLRDNMGRLSMPLDSSNAGQRREANRRVGLAINFISALPYTFAIEGGR